MFQRTSLIIAALVVTVVPSVRADETKQTPLSVSAVSTYTGTVNRKWCDSSASKPCEAGIGDRVVVKVDGLTDAAKNNQINLKELVIFLDGRPIRGVTATQVEDAMNDRVAFDLKRTDDSKSVWTELLGSPSLLSPYRTMTVSVGLPDKPPIPFTNHDSPPQINLRIYHQGWLVGTFIFMLVAIIVFVWLAKTTNIIRDANPPEPPAGAKRPYSLALTQASVWFFLVIGSFLFLYLVTGDYNTITEQALILIGIGTGTALGAAMIDSTKRDTSNTQLAALEPAAAKLEEEISQLGKTITSLAAATSAEDKQALTNAQVEIKQKQAQLKDTNDQIATAKSGLSKPVSESFRNDLLTDANGVNLHRFQMVVWTIVLAVLFCIGVYKELAMPAFSGTLLALMGISSGTYLGFKIPEKQG